MPATATPPQARILRITDPRLPITISRAALELDRAARGETGDMAKAGEFFDFLTYAVSSGSANGELEARWLDPITVNVFSHALEVSGRARGLRTVQDVVREALKVVREIDETKASRTKRGLGELRDFCVAFGNSLLVHRAQYSPQPPVHPHRKKRPSMLS